jgi:hypothetical protein
MKEGCEVCDLVCGDAALDLCVPEYCWTANIASIAVFLVLLVILFGMASHTLLSPSNKSYKVKLVQFYGSSRKHDIRYFIINKFHS